MGGYRGRHNAGQAIRARCGQAIRDRWLGGALVIVLGCVLLAWRGGGTDAAPVTAPAPVSTFSSPAAPPPAEPISTPAMAAMARRDWVELPALGISAHLVPEAIEAQQLTIPPASEVGWWIGGATPDARTSTGTTLLAAHVNLDGEEGAFAALYRAEYGDRIYVTDAKGRRSAWAVVAVATAAKAALPQSIFTATGQRRLVLVTCTGRLVATPGHGRSYDSNLVVTAMPLPIIQRSAG